MTSSTPLLRAVFFGNSPTLNSINYIATGAPVAASVSTNSKLVPFIVLTVSELLGKRIQSIPAEQLAFSSLVSEILRQTNISTTSIILSLLYIHRLRSNAILSLSSAHAVFKIWLTSLILADAYNNDNAFNVSSWKIVSGITGREIAALKMNFLNQLKFDLNVSPAQYTSFLTLLELHLHHTIKVQQLERQKIQLQASRYQGWIGNATRNLYSIF